MSEKPSYFDSIRDSAARRWQQLEDDPELAGPWHQLFKQVQSPRHVLSELLQNADDAEATRAAVRIEDGTFTFSHDGADFKEEHFASLCRFGYSNKRALHTIGFRGIGFKSTFSLGDRVELFTPTLSLHFDKTRFTQPHWQADHVRADALTLVRVRSVDRRRQKELEKNFQEWLTSSKSLLFFRNLRRIDIGDQSIHWRKAKSGPVPDSEWVALDDAPAEHFLHVRSAEEAFPDEALEEIRQERLLALDDKADFPPCRVEIVLGGGGRLYVVLPTGVHTDLPFACNAPFIQDPARLKIKDPEISPTNRWLLARCGRLAAETMLNWLGNGRLSLAHRAGAYGLIPERPTDGGALEDSCAAIVAEAFAASLKNQRVLLTEDGTLAAANESILVPSELLQVWPLEQAMSLLDDRQRPPMCNEIQDVHKVRLLQWKLVEEVQTVALLRTLRVKRIPKPGTWPQVLQLWAFVAPKVTGYPPVPLHNLRLVPVQGGRFLQSAENVVRLGEKRILQSEEDWAFLAQYLSVLDPGWTRFLAEQRKNLEESVKQRPDSSVSRAIDLLGALGLASASDVDDVVAVVTALFFGKNQSSAEDAVRLTQIAAKLGATLDEQFHYRTRDGVLRSTSGTILFDADGRLEPLLPTKSAASLLLHPDYTSHWRSCSKDEWLRWVSSGDARLHTFLPLVETESYLGSRRALDEEVLARGFREPVAHRYQDPEFWINDWDFAPDLVQHWAQLENDDLAIWEKVAECLLEEKEAFWAKRAQARIAGYSRNGSLSYSPTEGIPPKWVLRLREKPCLPDTRGFRHKPGDLLRRTPETEALLDVENFVHGRLDTERNRALLDLLGVQSTPTGPGRLLERLAALSQAKKPPVREVEKWYLRLDKLLETCSTEDTAAIRKAFRTQRIILTDDGAWTNTKGVFINASEEDVPGAAVVRQSVNDLRLWEKIGVADRPTVELAVAWLQGLPSGEPLSTDDARRVRGLLARHPLRIFEACGHWLNLAGSWQPVDALRFSVSRQSHTPWQHLHEWVKKETADLLRLPAETVAAAPFTAWKPLAAAIEERFSLPPAPARTADGRPWLTTLGAALRHVVLDSEEETARVRELAGRAAQTLWQVTDGLEIIPYIDGTPAGTARATEIAWIGETLYVAHLSTAKLARRIPEELGKVFARPDLQAALDYSFERAPEDIRAYLAENFTLAVPTEAEVEVEVAAAPADDTTPVAGAAPDTSGEAQRPIQVPVLSESVGMLRDNAPIEYAAAMESESADPDREIRLTVTKCSIMERFAASLAFRKVDNRRFVREDGSVIGHVSGSPFPWEHRDVAGNIVRWYWTSERCLERQPLEIEAEVWGLIEKYPQTYALILLDSDGQPTEVTGDQLVSMREAGSLTLYPAAYRLVQDARAMQSETV